MTATIYLAISRDLLLTSNQRIHYMAKARNTKAIREMAYTMARHERPEHMQAATCEVEVIWPDNRQRDCLNLEPTIKACLDGIIGDDTAKNKRVSYRLLPSDSDVHLRSVKTYASQRRIKTPGVACYLTFRFTEVA
jgi:hypothetical protein